VLGAATGLHFARLAQAVVDGAARWRLEALVAAGDAFARNTLAAAADAVDALEAADAAIEAIAAGIDALVGAAGRP
jgi:hypothetical protein